MRAREYVRARESTCAREKEHVRVCVRVARLVSISDSVPRTREKFQNAALFLPLDLPSTPVGHGNGSPNRRNLKTSAFRYRVDGKHFENGAFRKRLRLDNHVFFLTEFASNTIPK